MAYTTASQIERYMADLVNAERAKVGLDALHIEKSLNDAAEKHSEWMLAADVFSHTGKGGSSSAARIKEAGFDLSGAWRTGENIAMTSIDKDGSFRDEVETLMDSLMDSPGHKANILRGSFDYIGIGIEVGFYTQGGVTYQVLMATQNFGATSGSVQLDGGSKTTSANGTSSADTVAPTSGGTGQTKIFGSASNDRLDGDAGRDIVKGGAGSDKIFGQGGSDRLFGQAGGDKLFGQAGNDRLFGQAGNDRLEGGAGRDVMNGGAGRDTFVFRDGHGKDKVIRFDTEDDRILLDDALWAGTMGKAKVVDTFAKVTSNGVLLDFGSDELLLKGLDSADGLESQIALI